MGPGSPHVPPPKPDWLVRLEQLADQVRAQRLAHEALYGPERPRPALRVLQGDRADT